MKVSPLQTLGAIVAVIAVVGLVDCSNAEAQEISNPYAQQQFNERAIESINRETCANVAAFSGNVVIGRKNGTPEKIYIDIVNRSMATATTPMSFQYQQIIEEIYSGGYDNWSTGQYMQRNYNNCLNNLQTPAYQQPHYNPNLRYIP